MLGTGFELKQHTLFLPLAMPSFPIIPSASAISFSQFQAKNNVVGKEATKTAQLVLIRDATPSPTWKGNLPFFNFPHPPLNLISTLLLQGCIKIKYGYSKALELVRELQHNGLHMDNVIYGTPLAVCASNTKLEEAESYFNWMKDEGHSPNVFHYSSLLNSYSIGGNYRKADELVQDMKSAGLVPNKVYLQGLAVWQLGSLCLCTPRGT